VPGVGSADFVEKVEKSRPTKTREIAIRRNIAARRHLSPVADLARCLIVKLAGPPANFLNAASLGLPEIEHRRKGSFSTKSADNGRLGDQAGSNTDGSKMEVRHAGLSTEVEQRILAASGRACREMWKRMPHALHPTGSSRRIPGHTTYLLAALLILLFAYPFLDDSLPHRLISGLLNVGILVTAAYAASESRHMFLLTVFLAVPSFALQVAYSITKDEALGELLYLTYAIFYGFMIGHVLRYVLRPGEVTANKIHGAIAGYILTGLLWTALYLFLDKLHPGSFAFNGARDSDNPLVPLHRDYDSLAGSG
jgi:hypothetical protein